MSMTPAEEVASLILKKDRKDLTDDDMQNFAAVEIGNLVSAELARAEGERRKSVEEVQMRLFKVFQDELAKIS